MDKRSVNRAWIFTLHLYCKYARVMTVPVSGLRRFLDFIISSS